MTLNLIEQEINRITRQLSEAQSWAIEQFWKDHPDLERDDIEIVYLEGNPFSYYVRVKDNPVKHVANGDKCSCENPLCQIPWVDTTCIGNVDIVCMTSSHA